VNRFWGCFELGSESVSVDRSGFHPPGLTLAHRIIPGMDSDCIDPSLRWTMREHRAKRMIGPGQRYVDIGRHDLPRRGQRLQGQMAARPQRREQRCVIPTAGKYKLAPIFPGPCQSHFAKGRAVDQNEQTDLVDSLVPLEFFDVEMSGISTLDRGHAVVKQAYSSPLIIAARSNATLRVFIVIPVNHDRPAIGSRSRAEWGDGKGQKKGEAKDHWHSSFVVVDFAVSRVKNVRD
jgi:hypothetical protein